MRPNSRIGLSAFYVRLIFDQVSNTRYISMWYSKQYNNTIKKKKTKKHKTKTKRNKNQNITDLITMDENLIFVTFSYRFTFTISLWVWGAETDVSWLTSSYYIFNESWEESQLFTSTYYEHKTYCDLHVSKCNSYTYRFCDYIFLDVFNNR